jgi:hypothetical protein
MDFGFTLDIMPLILPVATVPLNYISVTPVSYSDSNSESDTSPLR